MKKIIYSLLAVCAFSLSLSSCLKEQEDIFDDLPTVRLKKEAEKIDATISTDDTWVMLFYTSNRGRVGCYNMALKFHKAHDEEDKVVDVQLEPCYINGFNGTTTESSLYQVIPREGPVLSFATGNKFMHYFSDPMNDGTAIGADFEFTVTNTQSDKIEMTGIKRGTKQTMVKLPAGTTVAQYFAKISAIGDKLAAFNYPVLDVNGAVMALDADGFDYRIFSFTYSGNNGVTTSYDESFGLTTTGLVLFEPFTLGNITFCNFTYDTGQNAFICTDPGAAGVKIRDLTIADVEKHKISALMSQLWWFQKDVANMGTTGRKLWLEGDVTMTSKGAALKTAALGTDAGDDLFYFTVGIGVPTYWGAFEAVYTPVFDAQNDKVIVHYTGSAYNANTVTFYNSYGVKSYVDAVAPLNSSKTYKVAPAADGLTLRLTDITDANRWFVLHSAETPL